MLGLSLLRLPNARTHGPPAEETVGHVCTMSRDITSVPREESNLRHTLGASIFVHVQAEMRSVIHGRSTSVCGSTRGPAARDPRLFTDGPAVSEGEPSWTVCLANPEVRADVHLATLALPRAPRRCVQDQGIQTIRCMSRERSVRGGMGWR